MLVIMSLMVEAVETMDGKIHPLPPVGTIYTLDRDANLEQQQQAAQKAFEDLFVPKPFTDDRGNIVPPYVDHPTYFEDVLEKTVGKQVIKRYISTQRGVYFKQKVQLRQF